MKSIKNKAPKVHRNTVPLSALDVVDTIFRHTSGALFINISALFGFGKVIYG
jgi:hypothetical protein